MAITTRLISNLTKSLVTPLIPSIPILETNFVSTWKTDNAGSSNDDQITLPLESSGNYDFFADYGDNTGLKHITVFNQAETTHTYASAGTFTVTISGTIDGWRFNNGGDRQKILEISNWGTLLLGNSDSYFYGASNLIITATDILDTSAVTTMLNAFRRCSSITTVPFMGDWDMSSVTNMSNMFGFATLFNQPIGSWDTSSVTNLSSMFILAILFNQPIGSWDMSSATNFNTMFGFADAFNQPIGSWDMSSATNLSSMFDGADAFNQPIGSWNTSLVTTMSTVFRNAVAFNQPVGSWDTSLVLTLSGMFQGADAFNQPVGSWNTSQVTNFTTMFSSADAFNQDISSWNVSQAVLMSTMLANTSFSTANYDLLLVAWEQQTLKNNVVFSVGSTQFSAGAPATAKSDIVANSSWIITDGGQAP